MNTASIPTPYVCGILTPSFSQTTNQYRSNESVLKNNKMLNPSQFHAIRLKTEFTQTAQKQ
jgi:hypothetical protein